jgi:polar amino acid transport system substrate-binding protein
MKAFKSIAVCLFVVCGFLAPGSSTASSSEIARKLEAIHWYSEEYPPYNFSDADGVPTGMAVDILMEAFKRLGVSTRPENIEIAPWNRTYKFIQRRAGTALFSMTYTPERQKLMKFVGPSIPTNISVMAPRSSRITANNVADLSALKIGVVRDDIGDQLVRGLALSDGSIVRKNSLRQLLYLLEAGRVDAVAYASDVFYHSVTNAGHSTAEHEEVFVLKEGYLGYAFHYSTPPDVLEPLQATIDAMREEGVIARIIDKYR